MTTVLVAWALAAWLPHSGLQRRYNAVRIGSGREMRYIGIMELSRPGMLRRAWRKEFSTHPRSEVWELAQKAPIRMGYRPIQDRSWGMLPGTLADPSLEFDPGMDDARGWPFPALWCSMDPVAIDLGTTRGSVEGGWPLGGVDSAKFRVLPVLPLWRGLAADSATFGLGWWALFAGVAAVRRSRRRSRGRCVGCGYRLEGGLCPECGPGPRG